MLLEVAGGLASPSSNICAADNGHGCLDSSGVVGRGVGSQGKCVNVGNLSAITAGSLQFKFYKAADTGNSSSGSLVIDLNSFALIGIHTFGDTERLVNSATFIMGHQKLKDLIKICVTSE